MGLSDVIADAVRNACLAYADECHIDISSLWVTIDDAKGVMVDNTDIAETVAFTGNFSVFFTCENKEGSDYSVFLTSDKDHNHTATNTDLPPCSLTVDNIDPNSPKCDRDDDEIDCLDDEDDDVINSETYKHN